MKKALVLSGGGAKGAYQIGVIKALNKLKMKYDIVVGCSIGSINACMYAMNSYHKSKRLWMKIKNSDIFTMPDNLSTNDMYLYLVKMFIKNKGLSFDQAEKFLRKQISEKKIRKSKIDFGIVTYSLNKRQPKMLRKDEIPEGKIIDYVVASSTCFPFIKTKKIGSDSYIDGGFYDNIPIDLAQKMGAEQVLAVDLSVLAIDRPVSDKKIKVDIIKCQDKTPFTINFNKKHSKKMFKLGYNDTMKHFQKLEGNNYTFYKKELQKNYNRLEKKYINIFSSLVLYAPKNIITNEIFKISKFKTLFLNIKLKKDLSKEILLSMEYLGELLDIDNSKIYSTKVFNRLLLKKLKNLKNIEFNKTIKGKLLVGYIYNKYQSTSNKEEIKKELFNIALIFPKEFLASIYLIAISSHPKNLDTLEYYNNIIEDLKHESL